MLGCCFFVATIQSCLPVVIDRILFFTQALAVWPRQNPPVICTYFGTKCSGNLENCVHLIRCPKSWSL